MSELDRPEIPEPEKASPSDKPDPTMNGKSNPDSAREPVYLDNEKLIEWMKATDKQIKILTIGQVVIAGAVMFLLFTTAKGNGLPS